MSNFNIGKKYFLHYFKRPSSTTRSLSRSRSLVKIGQDHHLCHHCQGTEAKVTRQRSEVNYLQMVYRCNLCVQYTSETLRALISHLGRVHQNDHSFHVLCGIDGCPRTYKNFYMLRSHFAQKHSAILERERIRVPQQAERPPDNPIDDGANNEEGDTNNAGNNGFDLEREVEQCKRSNVLGRSRMKQRYLRQWWNQSSAVPPRL